jgi:hypothetical protein
MIKQKEITISLSDVGLDCRNIPNYIDDKFGASAIRWFVSKITKDAIHLEITICDLNLNKFTQKSIDTFHSGKSAILNIVPTGIGCSIGGFAGDASPVNSLLSTCADYVITHPNTVNASNFISKTDNTLYTEGSLIDLFSKGLVNLYKTYSNKIGLIIEKTDKKGLEIILNIVNTVRSVYGIDIQDYEITDEYIGGKCIRNASGAYTGNIENIETLIRSAKKLTKKGVNAIAITSHIQDLPNEEYAKHFAGNHPNPVGGVEAVISHIISNLFRVPSAHAPIFNKKDIQLENNIVDCRGAGEISSESGLACTLIGLNNAPQIVSENCNISKDVIRSNNIIAVVAPLSSLGGIPMFYAEKNNIPIIAVKNNETILDVNKNNLGFRNVYEVENYPEAVGIIQAIKSGISIDSVLRPIKTLR